MKTKCFRGLKVPANADPFKPGYVKRLRQSFTNSVGPMTSTEGRHAVERVESVDRAVWRWSQPEASAKPATKKIVLFEKPGHGRITMTVPIEEPKPKSGFWEVVELICFLIMLPFTILGMRDGVQWFLGTGEYGGDDML